MWGTALAASSRSTVIRTSSDPAAASAATCATVPATSAVSVLVIDWTTIGASPPTVSATDRDRNAHPARRRPERRTHFLTHSRRSRCGAPIAGAFSCRRRTIASTLRRQPPSAEDHSPAGRLACKASTSRGTLRRTMPGLPRGAPGPPSMLTSRPPALPVRSCRPGRSGTAKVSPVPHQLGEDDGAAGGIADFDPGVGGRAQDDPAGRGLRR